ncbi:MAG: hypothetical protein CL610_13200 [Anaerolineaceae bacterium]|nr:hypothetical protein [Anaerolineaceae bacterium]
MVLLLVSLCAACVPATVPPQVAYTPGPAVQVIDGLYDSGVFRVQYPADWRVITSAAGDPVHVIFAAPDGDALMIVGEQVDSAPAPAGYAGPLQSEQREIMLADGVMVTVILNAAPDDWAQRLALFEQVVASVRASAD